MCPSVHTPTVLKGFTVCPACRHGLCFRPVVVFTLSDKEDGVFVLGERNNILYFNSDEAAAT